MMTIIIIKKIKITPSTIPVSAHYNASTVYDYFFNTFQRNYNGGSTLSVTNIKENGIDVDNAFWNGRFIGYGNGKTGFSHLQVH